MTGISTCEERRSVCPEVLASELDELRTWANCDLVRFDVTLQNLKRRIEALESAAWASKASSGDERAQSAATGASKERPRALAAVFAAVAAAVLLAALRSELTHFMVDAPCKAAFGWITGDGRGKTLPIQDHELRARVEEALRAEGEAQTINAPKMENDK